MNEQISFHLEVFDGPLELLLHLLKKNKVNIYDVALTQIVDQYMEYLETLQEMDLDVTGEFLVLASQLLLIKSYLLLPKNEEEEEEDPRDALAQRLKEYEKYRVAASTLQEWQFLGAQLYTKHQDAIDPAILPCNQQFDVQAFAQAFTEILHRHERKTPPSPAVFERLIRAERYRVQDQIHWVRRRLHKKTGTKLPDLFEGMVHRMEIITTFLAILELLKANHIRVEQKRKEFWLFGQEDA